MGGLDCELAERPEAEGPQEEESEVRLSLPGNPLIVPREEHSISRKNIDQDALKVLYRLIRSGHVAFLVGGGVRDLLLGKRPKDFDVSTDARPETVRKLFRNSRIIGRRFRMNHVYFQGNKIIEVSTFRAGSESDPDLSTLSADNTYGDPESDAIRRDLTINGLFYDPQSYCVIDYVGGLRDLNNRVVRMIGEPGVRFREDPVRMIRACRHAARTGFEIEQPTYDAICECAELIKICPSARVHEELMRELQGGCALESVKLLEKTGLLRHLMPELNERLQKISADELKHFEQTLGRIDSCAHEVPAAVLFLALSIDHFSAEQIAEAEKLKRVIDILFRPVGATKREREDMEMIMPLAHALFEACQGGRRDLPRLMSRPFAKEAALLIELTANNEEGYACVEQLKSALHRASRRGGGRQRRRGGRR